MLTVTPGAPESPGAVAYAAAPGHPSRAPHPPHRRFSRQRRSEIITGYAMAAPALIGSALFVLLPLGALVWYSLNEWKVLTGDMSFVGWANYERLFSDAALVNSLKVTGIFSVGLVVFNIALALALAVMLNQKFRGTAFFRAVFFSPVVVSLVAWTIVWGFLFQKDGGINGYLDMIGIVGPNWLREETTAMIAVIVVQVFKGVGLNMVLLLAALQGVPEELREAAALDGASRARIFRSVVMPLISPTLMLVSIVTVVGSLQVFAQIAVLTSGGPGNSTTVLVYYLYQQAFQLKDFGYGSAIAILLFVIVLILTLAQWAGRKKWVHYES